MKHGNCVQLHTGVKGYMSEVIVIYWILGGVYFESTTIRRVINNKLDTHTSQNDWCNSVWSTPVMLLQLYFTLNR